MYGHLHVTEEMTNMPETYFGGSSLPFTVNSARAKFECQKSTDDFTNRDMETPEPSKRKANWSKDETLHLMELVAARKHSAKEAGLKFNKENEAGCVGRNFDDGQCGFSTHRKKWKGLWKNVS